MGYSPVYLSLTQSLSPMLSMRAISEEDGPTRTLDDHIFLAPPTFSRSYNYGSEEEGQSRESLASGIMEEARVDSDLKLRAREVRRSCEFLARTVADRQGSRRILKGRLFHGEHRRLAIRHGILPT
jgi:hypothetical protein